MVEPVHLLIVNGKQALLGSSIKLSGKSYHIIQLDHQALPSAGTLNKATKPDCEEIDFSSGLVTLLILFVCE
jgi:hypothetical protein